MKMILLSNLASFNPTLFFLDKFQVMFTVNFITINTKIFHNYA